MNAASSNNAIVALVGFYAEALAEASRERQRLETVNELRGRDLEAAEKRAQALEDELRDLRASHEILRAELHGPTVELSEEVRGGG